MKRPAPQTIAILLHAACLITCTTTLAQNRAKPRSSPASAGQGAALPAVVVEGGSQELIGPYRQPRWSARGRFSSDTDVYVLPPWQFFVDIDYQGTFPRHGQSSHLFTQELEIGLPHRFQLAYENNFEVRGRRAQETVQTIEGRWALADWGKIPLNPTLFAEYKIGVGRETEAESEDAEEEEDEEGGKGAGHSSHIPNAFEVRLLLGQQFGEHFQWALNVFHEQEIGGSREVETGFSQALSYTIHEETFRVGAEMQFIRRTEKDSRGKPEYEFDLGPSLSFKPTRRTRFDFAALFGTTDDSPTAKLFAVFSIDFGPGGETEISAPVSTQNR